MIPILQIRKTKALNGAWLTQDEVSWAAGNIVLSDAETCAPNHPNATRNEGMGIAWWGLRSHLWPASRGSELSSLLETASTTQLPKAFPPCLFHLPALLPLSWPAALTPQGPEIPHRSREVATGMLTGAPGTQPVATRPLK